jgi:serine/threonine-protein kinase
MVDQERLTEALADRYTIEREIGSGGMATVYLALDLKHRRPVAIKVLDPELARSLGAERFLREIETAAKLTHPHILPLHDSGEADGLLYYVMPYVEGESVRERLTRERQLSVGEAVRIGGEIADALAYAHERGVIHRDVKPGNILLEAGHAVLADFGVAHAIARAEDQRLTRTGTSIGTPAYSSPEQATGEGKVDGRSDQYALGCVLYEMLAGLPPFTASTAESVIQQHLTLEPQDITERRPSVPAHVAAALLRALSKTPADRFGTTAEFSAALSTPAWAPVGGAWAVFRILAKNPTALLSAAVVVAVTAIALMILLIGDPSGPAPGVREGGVAQRPGPAPVNPLSETRVAFFPARVIGADSLKHYDEWVSDLLYRLLHGLGVLEGLDPNQLGSRLRSGGYEIVGTEEGRALAERLGAGLFVLSRIRDMGDSASLASTLYRTGAVEEPVAEAFDEGPWPELGAIASRVARELFNEYLNEADHLRISDAQIPYVSWEALQAYLEGERLLREYAVNPALAAFNRAIDEDSTFALAWFGRALVRGLFRGSYGREALEDALRYSSRLPRRDSLLLEGGRAFFTDVGLGTRASQELADRYPDYTWAWHTLGSGLLWSAWRRGGSPSEARAPLERALEMQPDHPLSLFFLKWVANFEERFEEHDSLAEVILGLEPDLDQRILAEATPSLRDSRGSERDSVIHSLRSLSSRAIADLSVDNWWNADVAVLLTDPLTRPEGTRVGGFLLLAQGFAGRGQWRSAVDNLDRASRLDPGRATAFKGLLAALPFLELPDSILLEVKGEVEAWDGSFETDPGWRAVDRGNNELQPSPALRPHLKSYLLGLLAGRLGEAGEARERARQLQSSVPDTSCSHLGQDLAQELLTLAAVAEGDPDEALSLVEEVDLDVCHFYDYVDLLGERPVGRYLRADLLQQTGRREESLGWFTGFAWGNGTENLLYKPFLYLRRAQLEESLARPAEALTLYRRFIEAWGEADPHLQHYVTLARERVRALS